MKQINKRLIKNKYIDLPTPTNIKTIKSKLTFTPINIQIKPTIFELLDFAYASGILQQFTNDNTIQLTIRENLYNNKSDSQIISRQLPNNRILNTITTGYEGKQQVILIQAIDSKRKTINIEQLYYPFRIWKSRLSQQHCNKRVRNLVFQPQNNLFLLYEFTFLDENEYDSISLIECDCFKLIE